MKKFIWKDNAWDNDDLQYALTYNNPTEFNKDDIRFICAEVCGENDGADWWWILKLKNNKFFLLSGGCDYTGWDCQSSINEHGFFKTARECAKNAPEIEESTGRKIRDTLLKQLSGKIAFGVYFEKNKG